MANDEVLGPRKTMLVLVIVVGCFAVLWPRILSPLIVGHTQEQIKPNKFDREAGCCEVIFQSEVAVLELVNEVCNSALGVDKLSPQSAIQCRKAVNETCGLDIAAFLKKNENVGKTTKMLVEAMKNMNSSCLRENFGVPIYSLSIHSPVNSWKLQESLKQERPVRGGGPHPALRERGRAIPPGVPGVPPPGRQQMPPHVRVRSPLSVYFELEPPPIPGMRPPLGSPGGPVTAPKSSMGFVMPIYTICIIVFFVYTLSKILFKRTGAPYEPITPDPQFRRRVFRDESRTSPDKIVVSAISGLVAEVEQQMEASQQRQESQDNQTRPYTNGTILLNTGPVQIVTSEYQEKEQTPDLAKSKQNLLERKDSSPESKHSPHDTQERSLVNDLKPIQEEAILTKDITESKEKSSQHETNSIKNLSQPNVPSSFKTSIDENETSTERREFSHETEGSFIEQYEPSHEAEYANKDNDLSPEPIEPTPQPKDSFIEQEDQEQHKSYLEQNDILLDPEEVSIDPKLSATEPKQTSQDPIENSILLDEPPPESKDMSIEQKESSPDLKDTSIQKNSSLYPDIAPEPKESSIENQPHSDSKESSQLIEEKYEYVERELFPEPKESSLEKELKELYESSSEEEFIPELLEDKVETEVSLSPEPEACITPDHEFPIKCDDKHSNIDNSSIPSKEATFGEDSIIVDTKELTPEPNKSLSGSNKPAAETDNEKLYEGIDETSVKEEFNTDKESLVLESFSKVLDNSDIKQDTIAKSTEEFLQEEREVATKDGPSTPELLAEALKEDTSKDEIELDNESSTVKVVGMEVTAHPADGSVWPGARPPLAPPKPPSQQHKAEDVKSIFLETEIPQQSRVLVADFEDNADKQKPAKNAPLVVSGKMTLSLIQDAPRDTPERDLESTVDEFTTASAATQPPAEREDSSDEDLDEEIEVEEIEEDLELESDEEVEPRAVSKSERK